MKSDLPKLLHPVAGLPIIAHVVRAATEAGSTHLGAVTAPGQTQIQAAIKSAAEHAQFFEQHERNGTAHAAQMAAPLWQNAEGYIIVVYGDHPLLRAENFELITDRLDAGMDVAILGFEPEDPTGYGRFITDGERLLDIREHKDASAEEREIGLCNACILGFKTEVFKQTISNVGNDNVQNEFYLGDLVPLANAAGFSVGYAIAPENDVIGVNDRVQLAHAEGLFQDRLRKKFMQAGVSLADPATSYFSYDTEIGRDVTFEPNVVIAPGVKIMDGARIRAFSHLEGAIVGANAEVGPYARLRPEAILAEGAKVGNFVEVKKANIGAGAKLSHLSYIGDADVGAGANIGAGTITCNYDGLNKHRTVIGEGAFIGSNSALVAPVTIGDGAFVASGSVITADVPANALGVARGRQENKIDYATKIRARAQAIKSKK